jgi:hypothetical protein
MQWSVQTSLCRKIDSPRYFREDEIFAICRNIPSTVEEFRESFGAFSMTHDLPCAIVVI